MASLRDIKRRIGSVKNTRQITKAMKMVAGAKLRRAQDRATGAKPYADSLSRVLGRVTASVGGDVEHPLLTVHPQVETVLVVLLASDKGLCGSFNGLLFRRTRDFIKQQEAQGRKVVVRTYGKKAVAEAKRRYEVLSQEIDLRHERYAALAAELGNLLAGDFQAGSYQEVYLAYNEFHSVMSQVPTFRRLLPMSVSETAATEQVPDELKALVGASGEARAASVQDADYGYEPSGQQLLETLLPLQLQTTLLQGFFESEAGEHASRMKAMDSATRNASDLIDSLTLQFNRARQAAITTELIEIVSGAEAL